MTESATATETKHEHKFKETMHLDGCHFYSTHGACSCGATFAVTNERDPKHSPYSLIWMEPRMREVRRDEKGRFCKPYFEEVKCQRCDELKAGARVKYDLVVVDRNGNIIREEHEEREQREPEKEEDELGFESGAEPGAAVPDDHVD